jgi:hypothetical protein
MAMTSVSNLVRHEGDPRVVKTGPSSLSSLDTMARLLGWFSIGLGLIELIAPQRVTRALGMESSERFVQGCGLREIGSGLLCLSVDKELGLWSRVAGDALDLTSLLPPMNGDNPKRDNVHLAAVAVAGIALLDLLTANAVRQQRKEADGMRRDYRRRSGFPQGVAKARGAASVLSKPLQSRGLGVHPL